MNLQNMILIIQNGEENFDKLFSNISLFSEHLYKQKDSELPDMYDHNAFVTNGMPTKSELDEAEKFQKENGYDFFKIDSKIKLPDEWIDAFHLEEDLTYTMLLEKGRADQWKCNASVEIRCSKQKNIQKDVLEVELQTYGEDFGEDFVRRKMRRYLDISEKHENFYYFGAYIHGEIAGACYVFVTDGWACIDGLAVIPKFRNQYVATTLLAHIAKQFDGKLYLHADAMDTPKDMYEKMGFYIVDRCYEYNYRD